MQTTEPAIISEVVKQIPALSVLAWLVWKHGQTVRDTSKGFLIHLEKRDEAFTSTLREVSEDSNRLMERAVDTIDRNSELLGRVAGSLDRQEQSRHSV